MPEIATQTVDKPDTRSVGIQTGLSYDEYLVSRGFVLGEKESVESVYDRDISMPPTESVYEVTTDFSNSDCIMLD